MQPLAARPGVGSILPIIDANWSSHREKSSYSGLQRGVGVLLPAKPRARTLSIGRNPPTSPQEGVFPDFSRIIGGLDGRLTVRPDLGYMKILDAIFWRLGKNAR